MTPANIAAALAGKVDSSYFSNGNNRSQYKNEIQPRLGFSYDLTGTGKTIVFGGAGRYYDRLFLNATLDERYRLQYPVYQHRVLARRPAGNDPADDPDAT